MEKIESIRKGCIWPNSFKTDDGEIFTTINKTYQSKDGKWGKTSFLNTKRGDIHDFLDCLKQFHEFKKLIQAEGSPIMNPSAFQEVK